MSKFDFQKIKKIQWVKGKTRPGDIAIHSFYTIGHGKKYFQKMGMNFEVNKYFTFKSGKIFFDKIDLELAEKILLNKKNLAEFVQQITNRFIKLTKNYHSQLKKWEKIKPPTLNRKEVVSVYEKFCEYNYSLVPYSFIISIIFDKIAEKKITEALANSVSDPYQTYLELTNNPKQTNTARLRQEIVRLALKIKKNKLSKEFIQKAILKLADKYGWLACYSVTDEPTKADVFLEQIKELLKEKGLFKESTDVSNKSSRQQLLSDNLASKLKFPLEIKRLVAIMRQNTWLRTYRRELMCYGFWITRSVHKRIAEILGCNFSDLSELASWEIVELIKGNKKIQSIELKHRKSDFVIAKFNSNYFIVSGQEVKKVKIKEGVIKKLQKLNGQIVFTGTVTAKAKLVKNKQDVDHFPKGYILVTHTVATWMLKAVERSSGIVTDAGGVLSHSAIVAREFRKPCIIGTKYATELVKDGDLLELNYDKVFIKK